MDVKRMMSKRLSMNGGVACSGGIAYQCLGGGVTPPDPPDPCRLACIHLIELRSNFVSILLFHERLLKKT